MPDMCQDEPYDRLEHTDFSDALIYFNDTEASQRGVLT